jgi:uncharacterized protein (TIGR03663 family)
MAERAPSSKEQGAINISEEAVHSWLTVERALYLGLGLVTLVLRLYALGRRPMQPQEARQALAAWQLVQGRPAEMEGCSPFVLTANIAVFALLGANDVAARLFPVLSGTVLVLLPYGLRRWLGREGALFAAALLAWSPLALFNARYLSGATAAGASMLLLLIGLAHWVEDRRSGAIHLMVGGLAGLLLSGPAAYTLLLTLASFGLLVWLIHRQREVRSAEQGANLQQRTGPDILGTTYEEWRPLLRQAGVSFALIVGLISTCFLLNLSGLQVLLDLLPAWGRGFVVGDDGLPWLQYVTLLPLYDLLILVFGLAGLVLAWRDRDLLGLFLGYWTLAALVLTSLMAARGVDDALLVILPLALLAGRLLGERLPGWVSEASWEQEGFFVALACGLTIYAGLQLSFFSLTGKPAYLKVIGVVGVLVACLFGSVAYWLGRQVACRWLGAWLLLVLGPVTLSAAIGLNFVHLGDPHELVLAAPISPDVHTLVSDVAHLSAQRAIDEQVVDITLHRGLALPLAWYLRDYANLTIVESLAPTVSSTAVLAHLMSESPSLGGAYGGQDYALRSRWNPASLRGSDWGQWLLRRQASTTLREERVILWVRQEER